MTEIEHSKPHNTIRILIFGGSAAWGEGGNFKHICNQYPIIPCAQTVDAALEKILSDDYPNTNFEVINCAAPGYYVSNSLMRYISYWSTFDADIVLSIDGHNDFFTIDRNYQQFYYHDYFHSYSNPITRPSLTAAVAVFLSALASKLNTVPHSLLKAIHGLRQRASLSIAPPWANADPFPELQPEEDHEPFQEEWRRRFREGPLRTLAMFSKMANYNNAKFVSVLQPLLYMNNKARLFGKEVEMYNYYRSSRNWIMTELQHRVNTEELLLAKEKKEFDFVNAHDAIQLGDAQVFTDYCHLTPTGHARLANVILGKIRNHVETSIKKPKFG